MSWPAAICAPCSTWPLSVAVALASVAVGALRLVLHTLVFGLRALWSGSGSPLSAEQLVDARFHFFGAIDMEGQLRHIALAHPFQHLRPDVATRGHETVERIRLFLRAPVDCHVDQRRLSSRIQHDLADVSKADARVRKFALDHCTNFIAQRLCHARLVVLPSSLFRHRTNSFRRTPGC